MTVVSPCVGICRLDDATGYCVGCARTGDEIQDWRNAEPDWRAAVWDALPARFQTLGVACRRLPWTTDEIAAFIARSLRADAGTWTVGVVGAVAEFAAMPGEITRVESDGERIEASTVGGNLWFMIDDQVLALTFDPPDTPSDRRRVVLAVKRARGGPERNDALTDLGVDRHAIEPEDRTARFFDLGLDREEARFCLRCAGGPALEALDEAEGCGFDDAVARLSPVLLSHPPTRVVESALGRIEVTTAIPQPGGQSPAGPHTHLLPDHIATGRALPAGMEVPSAYLPGAMFHPRAGGR